MTEQIDNTPIAEIALTVTATGVLIQLPIDDACPHLSYVGG